MERVSAVMLIAVCSLASAQDQTAPLPKTGPLPESDHNVIGDKSVAEALSELKANPKVAITQEGGWTIAREDLAIWSFTPAWHPAHPAVVLRTLVNDGGGTSIEMKVHCEATKKPCDQLVREFQALNEQLIESVKGSRP